MLVCLFGGVSAPWDRFCMVMVYFFMIFWDSSLWDFVLTFFFINCTMAFPWGVLVWVFLWRLMSAVSQHFSWLRWVALVSQHHFFFLIWTPFPSFEYLEWCWQGVVSWWEHMVRACARSFLNWIQVLQTEVLLPILLQSSVQVCAMVKYTFGWITFDIWSAISWNSSYILSCQRFLLNNDMMNILRQINKVPSDSSMCRLLSAPC